MTSIRYSVGFKGRNRPDDVTVVQTLLNAKGAKPALQVDGKVGPKTIHAIRAFQAGFMNRPDGRVDPGGKTLAKLSGKKVAASPPPPNLTARFETSSRTGQTRQMMTGRITVNKRTYSFRSGGHGRGNLPPGEYTVTPHLWNRSERGFSVGGVGYSFAVSDAYDARVKDTRTLLRIHPDGGSAGTNGCIGIVGDAAVQRQFREDMRAELKRHKNKVKLKVIKGV